MDSGGRSSNSIMYNPELRVNFYFLPVVSTKSFLQTDWFYDPPCGAMGFLVGFLRGIPDSPENHHPPGGCVHAPDRQEDREPRLR